MLYRLRYAASLHQYIILYELHLRTVGYCATECQMTEGCVGFTVQNQICEKGYLLADEDEPVTGGIVVYNRITFKKLPPSTGKSKRFLEFN